MTSRDFEVLLADTDELRNIHYRLRYQVFCLESGFEDPDKFDDRKEKDVWDASSQHFLVRERQSGKWAATMRLVLPRKGGLPINSHDVLNLTDKPSMKHCAEASRLCIVGHYRQRKDNKVAPFSQSSVPDMHQQQASEVTAEKAKRTASILKALMNASAAFSYENDIRYWYMLTTRSLVRILSHVLPLEFTRAGDACWHRGVRYPYLANLESAFSQLQLAPEAWISSVYNQSPTNHYPNHLNDDRQRAAVCAK